MRYQAFASFASVDVFLAALTRSSACDCGALHCMCLQQIDQGWKEYQWDRGGTIFEHIVIKGIHTCTAKGAGGVGKVIIKEYENLCIDAMR